MGACTPILVRPPLYWYTSAYWYARIRYWYPMILDSHPLYRYRGVYWYTGWGVLV